MATFLSLCGDLARESGAINPAPTAVTGQSGRQLQCVNWIIKAWVAIQNETPYWNWLRAEFTGTLTIGDASYTAAEMGIASRFSEWIGDTSAGGRAMSLYDNSIGRQDEGYLHQITWEQWKRMFDIGVHDNNRPTYWAIAPDGSLRFGATPDKAYKVRGEYRKTPQVLAANTDEPEMPARFHDAIWQRAIMLMAASDEAVNALQMAKMEYDRNLVAMQRDCLPKITTRSSGPLDR